MLIDYPTRADLVAALVEFNSQGVDVQVVGLGLTLKVPDSAVTEDLIGEAPPEKWDNELVSTFVDTANEEEIQEAINQGLVTEEQVMEALDKLEESLDPDVQQFVDHLTEEQLRQAVADGHLDKETLRRHESAGKARKGVLAFATEDG